METKTNFEILMEETIKQGLESFGNYPNLSQSFLKSMLHKLNPPKVGYYNVNSIPSEILVYDFTPTVKLCVLDETNVILPTHNHCISNTLEECCDKILDKLFSKIESLQYNIDELQSEIDVSNDYINKVNNIKSTGKLD